MADWTQVITVEHNEPAKGGVDGHKGRKSKDAT